jgi:acyl phosphate:glycerol-3-phosphate acyltransferase
MLNVGYILLAGLIGYLCGAIPFGFLYVKAIKGIDLRQEGSGRTGGTNSMRAAGVWVGVLTALSDVFKGFLGVWISQQLFGATLGDLFPWAVVVIAAMCVIGHNWSVFLGWKGGAGTGPNVGWATAIWWPMLPIGGLVMGGMLLFIGMASVASMSMALIIPIVFAVLYFTGSELVQVTPAYMIAGLITSAIVAWALRPNFKRLLAGNERVVGPRAKRMKRRETADGNR